MDRLKTEFDRPTAKALYAQLARIIHEDEPVTFMHGVGEMGREQRIRT
jgi:hypothetical protein